MSVLHSVSASAKSIVDVFKVIFIFSYQLFLFLMVASLLDSKVS